MKTKIPYILAGVIFPVDSVSEFKAQCGEISRCYCWETKLDSQKTRPH